MARCDLCGNAPRWIYRVGDEEICGACCAKRLSEQRVENAKLREENKRLHKQCGHTIMEHNVKEGGDDE